MTMEFRQLQYTLQIAAERNFSRAAEKLHIAQPSLSQQLSKLEKELGVLLFQRNTSTVELTHAGVTFVEQAQKIVDAVELLRQEMSDISQLRKGKVVVGSMPITGSHLLPHVLPAFQQAYPEIEVTLLEDSGLTLEKLTASGKADLSLLSLPLQEPSLAYVAIGEEKIDLAVPPNHPLARRADPEHPLPVRIEELRDEPFVVLKKDRASANLHLISVSRLVLIPKLCLKAQILKPFSRWSPQVWVLPWFHALLPVRRAVSSCLCMCHLLSLLPAEH